MLSVREADVAIRADRVRTDGGSVGGASADDRRWRAVLARDAAADGMFVFAVRSTGVYCRPSCPARRPRRDRVHFFHEARQAAQAGYRPCRRCRPDQPAGRDEAVALAQRACRFIETHLDEPLGLDALAAALGRGPQHVRRVFTQVLGISPKRYLDACRLDLVKARLRAQAAVTTALYDAGYGSSSRLYERAARRLGMTPAAYRRGGAGATIRYTTAGTALGRLLVGETDRGVCAVSLGDTEARQIAALRAEFPAARLTRDDGAVGPAVRSILAYLDGRQPHLDLPLDIRATAFQGRVWDALRAIPYGATRSYSEVARAIGRPAAVRAVAQACAANPVPLVIPCHRVIRNNGDLGGYRLGLERKRALLDREQEARLSRAKDAQTGRSAAG
ncbi:MAG TPA: bifunctional DNA-binding transcriptional regulator/O6-methylguanine-DNA methyltransferase Ada [bacterium]|nr:bifunctional DNA-binding transcriptional regulator/O6-methylguanine-DNA methyltransferase Ada [bacterium]